MVKLADMFDAFKEATYEDRYVLKPDEEQMLNEYITKFPITPTDVTLFRISSSKSVFDTIIEDLTGSSDHTYDSMYSKYCSVVHFVFTYFLSKRLEDLLSNGLASLPLRASHTAYFKSRPEKIITFKIKLDPIIHELSDSDDLSFDSVGENIGPVYNVNSSEDEPYHVYELMVLYRNILTAP